MTKQLIEMLIFGGKTTINYLKQHLCAMFTSRCMVAHADHANTNFKKIVLIPKLRILRYLSVSSMIKTYCFNKIAISIYSNLTTLLIKISGEHV